MSKLTGFRLALGADRSARWLIFAGIFVFALCFAAYTNHAWEDYYITYRVSKNFATGHGLVYTVGERVHAFTSPINVLLPAVLNMITGNTSDELVLWLFRVVSSAFLAAAAVLLFETARKNSLGLIPTALLVGLFGLDAKIVDFSINGQETGFMMFFLALTLHALTVPSRGTALKLGLAWTGLMWTRPDGFIYMGIAALGFVLFNAGLPIGRSRLGLLKTFLYAGAVTTVLYLPWVLWAWHYYGSPIPHTITAKGYVFGSSPLTPARGSATCSPFRSACCWEIRLRAEPFCRRMRWLLAGGIGRRFSTANAWPISALFTGACRPAVRSPGRFLLPSC